MSSVQIVAPIRRNETTWNKDKHIMYQRHQTCAVGALGVGGGRSPSGEAKRSDGSSSLMTMVESCSTTELDLPPPPGICEGSATHLRPRLNSE
eukprot:6491073-Amphidinium_carterae.2